MKYQISILVFFFIISNSYAQNTIYAASEPDYPPFCIVNENGEADGFSVDLFKEAASSMDLKVEIKVDTWHKIKEELAEGRIDALPLVGRSPERDEVYDFTFPYHTLHGAVFVRKGTSGINYLEDLKTREIIVMKGDNAEEYVLRNNISSQIICTENYQEAFELLKSGEHDAVIAQRLMGLQLLNLLEIDTILPLDIKLDGFSQDFSFAVEEGNRDLLAKLNEGLAIIVANGTYDELYKKWFTPEMQMRVPFKEILKTAIYILIPIIILIFFITILVLRSQVNFKTKDLRHEIIVRKQAGNAFRNERDNLKNTFEAMVDGVYIVDQQFDIQYVNPVLIKDFGSFEGHKCYKYFYDRRSVCPWCKYPEVLEGKTVRWERQFAKTGKIYDLIETPIKNTDGSISKLKIFRDITEQKESEVEIKNLLNEKEMLLKEVHHRIKNNMNTIGSLLLLQSDRIGIPEAAAALQDAIARIESMGVLYDKLYRTESYNEVLSMEYISQLVDEIFQLFPNTKNIKIEKQLDDFTIDAKTIFPLGIIVNELITNIMKYAFTSRDSGRIEVTLKEVHGNVTLTIQDNGNGLPKGFNTDTQKGFGLMLVNMLTQQLEGNFTIENNNGTKSILEFNI